jgi:hypothetical protein
MTYSVWCDRKPNQQQHESGARLFRYSQLSGNGSPVEVIIILSCLHQELMSIRLYENMTNIIITYTIKYLIYYIHTELLLLNLRIMRFMVKLMYNFSLFITRVIGI